MAIVPPDYNNGPHGRAATDEALTTAVDASIPTPSFTQIAGDAVAGIQESVTDFVNDPLASLPAIPDLSLTSGINIDSLFSLGGEISNPFGDLSINGIGSGLSGNFDIGSVVDQFGIGGTVSGLLGNLPISINTNVAPPLEQAPNVLHNYASYTYRITLGAQDVKDHQQTASEGFTIGTPKITTMLMASGGGHAVDGTTRDPIFEEDFYIGDLKMATVIGANASGNGSNAVSLTFSIVEPYAVSLIERLLALSEKLGYKNYIEIPFVFKIEFVGYNDAGEMIGLVPQTTKYIPFRLTYMKFEVAQQGSIYECTGIPMNHFTFNQTVEALPEAVEVAAGKVGEFFNGKAEGPAGSNTTGGLVNAVNGFHSKLAKTVGVDAQKNSARNAADKIRIIIDPEIAKHRLEVGNLSKVGMLDHGFDPSKSVPQVRKPTYGFHAGTAITSVIKDIIKNSTFWTQQVEENKKIDDANAAEAFSKAEGRAGAGRTLKRNPLISPKITARYKMLEYDEKANRHAYEATFIVAPNETSGQQSASIGRSEIENIAKEYDYLFTGKNQDILNLDIKFDLAFYNNAVVNTESVSDGTPGGNIKSKAGGDKGDNLTNNLDPLTKTPIEKRPPSSIENIGSASKEDILKMKASALERSIMQNSAGDMITLDLNIIGDPAFIKQDDILYANDGDQSSGFTSNGSIKQDNGDMYLRLRFKTFDDINHDNGLRYEARNIFPSSFQRKSTFDGFYRIMMLDSTFSDGNFTQDLVVVRTYVQDTDDLASDAASSPVSSLVSVVDNKLVEGVDFITEEGQNVVNRTTSVIDGVTTSTVETITGGGSTTTFYVPPPASQAVDEAKALAGDFYAEQVPAGASEYLPTNENLIPGDLGFSVDAESIESITSQTPLNADINSRRQR